MSLATRIIPCLDVTHAGCQGVNFVGLRDAGDPVEMRAATTSRVRTNSPFWTSRKQRRAESSCTSLRPSPLKFHPPDRGGGVVRSMTCGVFTSGATRSHEHFRRQNPQLVADSVPLRLPVHVVAIDAKKVADGETPHWEVFTHGGRKPLGWTGGMAKKMESMAREKYCLPAWIGRH